MPNTSTPATKPGRNASAKKAESKPSRSGSTGPETPITIDSEFQELIPPLGGDERAQLEKSLKEDGCRDPLLVWEGQNVLVDGHHRHRICEAHGIGFKVRHMPFPDRSAAMDWMILNQLGRRNLAPKDAALLRGKLFNSMKRTVPNPAGANQHKEVKGQSDPQPTTAQRVAEMTGVSEKTVKRDAAYAAAAGELGDEFDKRDSKDETIRKAKVRRGGLPAVEEARLEKSKAPDEDPGTPASTAAPRNEGIGPGGAMAAGKPDEMAGDVVELRTATGTGVAAIPEGAPIGRTRIEKRLAEIEKKLGKGDPESAGALQHLFLECVTVVNRFAVESPKVPRSKIQGVAHELWYALG